jgi:1-acyl-sn-glycerol-3-phosphate acyltransferase
VRGDEFSLWWRVTIPLLMPILWVLFRVRAEGWEHVPRSGPVIIAFNHVSVLDGPALGLETVWRVRRRMRFLVAAELFERPLIGFILRRYDQIPIARGRGDTSALDTAIATIRDGAVTALAPEGRVDDHGGIQGLQRLRRGIVRIAAPTGAPIVPVGIWGTQARWPRAGRSYRRPWRPRLGFSYGVPITPPAEDEPADVFLERLRIALDEQVTRARRLAGATT